MSTLRAIIRDFTKQWGFFEYTVLVLILLATGFVVSLTSSKTAMVTVEVRITNRDMLGIDDGAPSVHDAQYFIRGLSGKGALGQSDSQIISVESFDRPPSASFDAHKTVYVTVKVPAVYNAKDGRYTYQGVPIFLGDWIRFEVGPVAVAGIVSDINGRYRQKTMETMTVNALLESSQLDGDRSFQQSGGVESFIADRIHVGDEVKSDQGAVLAKVVGKTNIAGVGNSGPVIGLTLELTVTGTSGGPMFLGSVPVKVNSRLPLIFAQIVIEPRVTEIVSGGE